MHYARMNPVKRKLADRQKGLALASGAVFHSRREGHWVGPHRSHAFDTAHEYQIKAQERCLPTPCSELTTGHLKNREASTRTVNTGATQDLILKNAISKPVQYGTVLKTIPNAKCRP
jgi:hypothetical protein